MAVNQLKDLNYYELFKKLTEVVLEKSTEAVLEKLVEVVLEKLTEVVVPETLIEVVLGQIMEYKHNWNQSFVCGSVLSMCPD